MVFPLNDDEGQFYFYTEGNKGKEGTDKNFGLIFKDYCISILSVLTYVPRGTEKKNHDK